MIINKGGTFLKNKLLSDSIVYIICPILLFNFINISINKFVILSLMIIIGSYTIITKDKESRINLTGLMFSTIYFLISLFRQNVNHGFDMYIYDTYCMIICTLIIIFLLLLHKNIFKLMYIDIRRCKGDNNLRIFNNIRKANLELDFKRISLLTIIHLLSLIAIRLISINILGYINYEKTYIIQVIINIVFIMSEIYMVSKLRDNIRKNIKVKNKVSRMKKLPIGSRIIDIKNYKNLNE